MRCYGEGSAGCVFDRSENIHRVGALWPLVSLRDSHTTSPGARSGILVRLLDCMYSVWCFASPTLEAQWKRRTASAS
jgi:hypothetical protein